MTKRRKVRRCRHLRIQVTPVERRSAYAVHCPDCGRDELVHWPPFGPRPDGPTCERLNVLRAEVTDAL